MNKIKIIITRGKDNFGAYAENVKGIYGEGDTAQEAKQSIVEAIDLFKKYNEDKNIPKILKQDFELVFKMDVASLLSYYKGILTNSGLEKLTGINQQQLNHYSSGLKKPRENSVQKIETALHNLGHELISLEL